MSVPNCPPAAERDQRSAAGYLPAAHRPANYPLYNADLLFYSRATAVALTRLIIYLL